VSFEEFKQACGRPNATMVRTTATQPVQPARVVGLTRCIRMWSLPYRCTRQVAPVPDVAMYGTVAVSDVACRIF
jgi:hypothetical protein